METFYSEQINNGLITLDADESRHCIKVLRKQPGDTVAVVDGHGYRYTCAVAEAHAKKAVLSVQETTDERSHQQQYAWMAVAPTKNSSRYEWFVEKAVEIGVERITPILTAHSERRKLNTGRTRKIMVSAMKQSGRSLLPVLDEPVKLGQWLKQRSFEGCQRYAGVCEGDRVPLKRCYKPNGKAVILIGPEGDFSAEELVGFKKYGFQPITLGNSRLRVETAALAACHTIRLMND